MKRFSLFLSSLLVGAVLYAAIPSEYCSYYGDETKDVDTYVALSWQTDDAGNVVITMTEGPGASSCSFRNGGFEGGIDAFVVSTDEFATTTPASNYFTAEKVYSGNLFTLVKNADVPAGAKIKHVGEGHAFAWKVNGEDAYCFPDFIYTYGGVCEQWAAPTNVAVSADSVITFTAVEGAELYTAYVSLGGAVKHEQAVVSGDKLHFSPLASGIYKVTVVAFGKGKLDSDPSAAADWELTAPEIVVGPSEYCGYTVLPEDNREAQFTWITDEAGSVVITILDKDGKESDDFHFRGTGMAIGSFKVGSMPADTYLNHACAGNKVTLSVKDASNAPSKGEKITFNAVVEYATALDNNAWPTIAFEYTYGTVCDVEPTAIEYTEEETQSVRKIMENGVLYILRDGVRYTTTGQPIR